MCTKSGSFLSDPVVFTEQLSTQGNTSWVLKTIYSRVGLIAPGCVLTAGFVSLQRDSCLCYKLSLMQLDLWKKCTTQRQIFLCHGPLPLLMKSKSWWQSLFFFKGNYRTSWERAGQPQCDGARRVRLLLGTRLRTLSFLFPRG